MANPDLNAVTRRLIDALAGGRSEALDLVDVANRIASPQAGVLVQVDDFDAAVRSLLRSAQARKRMSDGVTAARRLTELADELDLSVGYSLEEFGARMADRAERIVLLAQSGGMKAAVTAANEAMAWVGDDSLRNEPHDVLLLELRGDLLWAAAEAFGNNDLFLEAVGATAAALTRSADFPQTSRPEIQDHLALKLSDRALILAESGSRTESHLTLAHTALTWLSDDGWNGASGLNLRLRWAVASADDDHAVDVLRTADAAGLADALDLPSHRRAALELLGRHPAADAWLQEFGPFAAPLYAEARDVSLAEAYAWLGSLPPASASSASSAPDRDSAWPPRALTIGRLVLADADMDLDAIARHEDLRTTAVHAVPTASLRTYLESSNDDPLLAPWVAIGSQAASAGDDIHHQVAAMLAYFDRHNTPTEASFTCAAILAGMATALLGPEACISYADHLLMSNHDVALENARHGVSAPGRTVMPDQTGIFICYSSADSRTGFIAGRLYERLCAAFGDGRVFTDVVLAAPGVDVVEATEHAIAHSAAMVVLIGPGWNPDATARTEIEEGLSRGLRLLPVLAGAADMPQAAELPEELVSLARRQPLPLRHERFDSDVARLIDALDGITPAQAPDSAREASSPAVSSSGATSSGNEFGMAVSAFVAADVDLNVLIDGELALRVDHAHGFDYASATIVVRPDSVITFQAPGFSIDRRASQIVDGDTKNLKVRVGTDTRANIPITTEQRRAAMGTPDDVPGLIEVLTRGANHSARAWAATRLGAIGDRRAVAPLMAVVDGVRPDQDLTSEWVQSQAAQALAALGDPVGAPAIQRALDKLPNRDHYAYLFEAALRDLPAAG
jgi:hypothetical protein